MHEYYQTKRELVGKVDFVHSDGFLILTTIAALFMLVILAVGCSFICLVVKMYCRKLMKGKKNRKKINI